MSSMLKKPGAGAFKPKAPIARRRPAPNLPGQSTPVQELTPGPSQDAATPSSTATESTARPDQPQPQSLPGTSAEATPTTTTTVAPSTSQTASSSSQGTPAIHPPPAQSQEPLAAQLATRPQDSVTIPAEASSHDVGSLDNPPGTAATTDKIASSDQIEQGHAIITTTTDITTAAALPEDTVPELPSTSWATPPLPTPDATLIPSVESNDNPAASEPTDPATATRQPKQQAPRKPRKRKTASTAGEDGADAGAGADADTLVPPKKKRAAPRKKKATVTEDTENRDQQDATEADAGTGADDIPKAKSRAKTTKPRAPRKRKADTLAATTQNGVDTGSASEATEGAAAASKRKRGGGRKRAATPEDAENLRIDPSTVTIGELTRDIKTGKRWKDGQKILDADMERKREAMRQRLIRQGLLQEGEPLPNEPNAEAGGDGRGTPAAQSTVAAPPAAATASAPRPPSPAPFTDMIGGGGISIRVVDGQIVTNENSMQYDRHAEADRVRGELEVREENDFTKRVTQLTYLTRKPSKTNWPDEDTAKFYHGLRMFGTDFNTIAKMFGGARDRRQIKLKFNREERLNPEAVNKCLIGEKAIAMDLEAVGGSQGLEESKVIQDELARLREAREAETKRLEDEINAEAKRKRDELLGKRKGDNVKDGKGRHHHDHDAAGMADIVNGAFAEAIRNKNGGREGAHPEANPGAKYGVGTDPDVIDETDLPATSARSGAARAAAVRGRGARGGRRGGGKASIFASGFGL